MSATNTRSSTAARTRPDSAALHRSAVTAGRVSHKRSNMRRPLVNAERGRQPPWRHAGGRSDDRTPRRRGAARPAGVGAWPPRFSVPAGYDRPEASSSPARISSAHSHWWWAIPGADLQATRADQPRVRWARQLSTEPGRHCPSPAATWHGLGVSSRTSCPQPLTGRGRARVIRRRYDGPGRAGPRGIAECCWCSAVLQWSWWTAPKGGWASWRGFRTS